jgi:photosystem II stability/assembly factor-like uncharacterized protein
MKSVVAHPWSSPFVVLAALAVPGAVVACTKPSPSTTTSPPEPGPRPAETAAPVESGTLVESGTPGAALEVSDASAADAPASAGAAVAGDTGRKHTWRWLNPLPQGESLDAVVASAACGVIAVGDESTVVRSDDDGLTWTATQWQARAGLTLAALDGTTLLVVGAHDGASELIAAADCGRGDRRVLRTFDRKTDGACNDLATDGAGNVYLTTVLHQRGRVLCSSDHGATFRVCDERTKPLYGLFASPAGGVWVAGGYKGDEGGFVRESRDHGKSWRTVGAHLGELLYGVWGDATGEHLVATGTHTVATRSGSAWTTASPVGVGGGSMMIGHDDAPYVHNDFWRGVTGSPRTSTFLTLGTSPARGLAFAPKTAASPPCPDCMGQLNAATVTPSGAWVGVGGRGGVLRSDDDAASWRPLTTDALAAGQGIVHVEQAGRSLYVLQGTRMVRSKDGGRTFEPLGGLTPEDPPTPATVVSTADLESFAVDGDVLVVPRPARKTIAYSNNAGEQWAETSAPHDDGKTIEHAWAGAQGVMFASGKRGAFLRSIDHGAHWGELALSTHDDLITGWSRGAVVLVASGSGTVWASANSGVTWKDTALGEPLVAVGGVDEGELYAVGRQGSIFRSTDRGATWTPGARLGRDVRGFVPTYGWLALTTTEDDQLHVSTDRGATFHDEAMPMRGGLLAPDGRDGVYLARENGFSELLHLE